MTTLSVLVIGSGLAGLVAAVRATDAGHHVVLVTKAALPESNTRYAQGGIAAALFPDDSVRTHIRDTLRAGSGLCSPAAVRILCSEGPARVRDLIRFGVDFDRDESGVSRGLEAAHSRSRVVHAGGDATGAVVENALVATARQRAAQPNARLQILEHTMLTDLAVTDGRVTGVRIVQGGKPGTLAADVVVLATGGGGMLYRHTTNPAVATGDGLAAAWRAGASVADLEFYQFHPTALAVPGTPLVSEAVRGEGAVLLTRAGDRFMITEHPDAELAPRDVVARGIARQMAAQSGEPVVLDATALGRELLERRFPTITAACRAAGLDWARQPIPVAPAAHYWMGGIVTDIWGRSTLPGLYAVGEVARTGAHGANRLASNSLLEAAVFADRAVRALASEPGRTAGTTATLVPTPTAPPTAPSTAPSASAATPGLRGALQDLMWQSAGVHRSGAGLATAVQTLAGWSAAAAPRTVAEHEDRNLLDLARITVAAALERQESRGAHHRADFPDPRAELAVSSAWTIAAATPHPLRPDDVDSEAQEAIAC
ncbi:L-aspartate oxidase [Cryobacterium frigoriphilum]|uniref:L-aspartate oxidase n=1 Tax=Cryobacterium frigoriphilum TaxID=1259150 RepID=A0A4R9A1S6_9MICO|nr:L-aspartate oxidase [Cryobacterium frigoriphilum]TFD50557.1 L-aspartate oxidase [Cryobacterium frigoriphilum]